MKNALLLVMKLEKLNVLVQLMAIMIIFFMMWITNHINAGNFLILILKDLNLVF